MRLGELDTAGAIFARTHGHFEPAERVVGAFSRTGEHGACWVVLGLTGAAVDPERRNEWLRGVGAVITAYLLNYAIKLIVRRRRPEFEGLPPLTPTVSRLSFPSAHATTSFAAARALGRLIAPAPLYAVALAFALSRPYLGVHYPGDVLAGAVVGTAVGSVLGR